MKSPSKAKLWTRLNKRPAHREKWISEVNPKHKYVNGMDMVNSMRRQKDRTLKDELPRSVGAQYATDDWQRMKWHHWFNGNGFGWTPGVGDRQGGLACCGSCGRKESDTTEQLNWTEWWLLVFLNVFFLTGLHRILLLWVGSVLAVNSICQPYASLASRGQSSSIRLCAWGCGSFLEASKLHLSALPSLVTVHG